MPQTNEYMYIGSKDAWCLAVEAACREVGVLAQVTLVHSYPASPWCEGGFVVDGVRSHAQFHAVHQAMVVCDKLRQCKSSPALTLALAGEKFCGPSWPCTGLKCVNQRIDNNE